MTELHKKVNSAVVEVLDTKGKKLVYDHPYTAHQIREASNKLASRFKVIGTLHEQFLVDVSVIQAVDTKVRDVQSRIAQVEQDLSNLDWRSPFTLEEQIEIMEQLGVTLENLRANARTRESDLKEEIYRKFEAEF